MAELYALEYNSHGRASLLNFEKTGDKENSFIVALTTKKNNARYVSCIRSNLLRERVTVNLFFKKCLSLTYALASLPRVLALQTLCGEGPKTKDNAKVKKKCQFFFLSSLNRYSVKLSAS